MTAFWRTLGRTVKYYLLALAGMHFLPAVAAFLHLSLVGMVLAVTALAMATNSEKSRTTEDRVNGVVASLGTTNSNLATTTTTANNALPKSGGTVTGPLTAGGGLAVTGNITSTGSITAGTALACGSTVNWPGGISMSSAVADMCVVLDGGTFNATLTIYGDIGVHGNVNYTGSLNHV